MYLDQYALHVLTGEGKYLGAHGVYIWVPISWIFYLEFG